MERSCPSWPRRHPRVAYGCPGGRPCRRRCTARRASTAGRRGQPRISAPRPTCHRCSRRQCIGWRRRPACAPSWVWVLGPGRGELLTSLYEREPQWRLIAVEVAERPATLPDRIEWMPRMPIGLTALVIANEWLDNVPLDVVTITADGPRLVLVDPVTGDEEPGPRPRAKDLDWLSAWWPLHDADIGDRAEIGYPGGEAGARGVSALAGGVALAIDYGHLRGGRPRMGSLAGYRRGRLVA